MATLALFGTFLSEQGLVQISPANQEEEAEAMSKGTSELLRH